MTSFTTIAFNWHWIGLTRQLVKIIQCILLIYVLYFITNHNINSHNMHAPISCIIAINSNHIHEIWGNYHLQHFCQYLSLALFLNGYLHSLLITCWYTWTSTYTIYFAATMTSCYVTPFNSPASQILLLFWHELGHCLSKVELFCLHLWVSYQLNFLWTNHHHHHQQQQQQQQPPWTPQQPWYWVQTRFELLMLNLFHWCHLWPISGTDICIPLSCHWISRHSYVLYTGGILLFLQ